MDNPKDNRHIHISQIPKKYFPRATKAPQYLQELLRMMSSLRYTNEKVQYTAQLCSFNIKAINHKSGFAPRPSEVFRIIETFVFQYENFCFRGFAFREKLLQFINAILPVGYDENFVKINHMVINPIVKQAKVLPIIQRFKEDDDLGTILKDRNSLTHKLYYGITFDHHLRPMTPEAKDQKEQKAWFDGWKQEITNRAKAVAAFTDAVYDINHDLAPKIIAYRESLKRNTPQGPPKPSAQLPLSVPATDIAVNQGVENVVGLL